MRLARIVIVTIAGSGLLLSGCNDGGPAQPAPSQGDDGTTEFSKASSLSPSQITTNKAQVVMDNIAGQSATVKGAVEGLKAANAMVAALAKLLAELQAEASQQGEGESDEAYQKRTAEHQAKTDAAKKDLQKAQAAVDKAIKAVDAAQQELQKMQNADLPRAQQEDAKAMESYFEEEKKKLEAAMQQAASSLEETKTDTDDKDESAARAEVKIEARKSSTVSSDTGQQAAADPTLSGGSPQSSGLPVD
ncbi:MAG: hypothetical protein JRF63_00805 [Deltaproteobacteria bacterium]|nr:hypothetical protein [Deltaproteobacteria bacterium]